MKLLIDQGAAKRFGFVTADRGRRYYVTRAGDPVLALLVCRENLDLDSLAMAGAVVDAIVGWEEGFTGFVLEPDIGRVHTKVTIWRRLRDGRHEKTLSQILLRAPGR